MSRYHLKGRVGKTKIDTFVTASDGAEALKKLMLAYWPKFGPNWKEQRRKWAAEHVRVNVTQVEEPYNGCTF